MINLCEVYYVLLRTHHHNEIVAHQAVADLQDAGIRIREDIDREFWQQVAKLKADPGKLSLADCFALALAIRTEAILVTSDHHEFDRIAKLHFSNILFIR